MCERAPRGGAARSWLALVALNAWASAARAEDDSVTLPLSPYVNARATDGAQAVDVGVEFYPSATSALGGRLLLSTRKDDPDESVGEASSEDFDVGLRLQVLSEFGRGARERSGEAYSGGVSLFGVGADLRWGAALYEYRPGAGAERSEVVHSWRAELRGWWFGGVGGKSVQRTLQPVSSGGSAGPIITVVDVSGVWLLQPQLRLGWARAGEGARERYVVGSAGGDGLQFAEKVVVDPPLIRPAGSLLLALSFQPPGTRFAFGPAVRIWGAGRDGGWRPWGEAARVRVEGWVYHFVFDVGAAVRLGVSPFVDVRFSGDDGRDGVVAGGVLEFRTTVSRLEY